MTHGDSRLERAETPEGATAPRGKTDLREILAAGHQRCKASRDRTTFANKRLKRLLAWSI